MTEIQRLKYNQLKDFAEGINQTPSQAQDLHHYYFGTRPCTCKYNGLKTKLITHYNLIKNESKLD